MDAAGPSGFCAIACKCGVILSSKNKKAIPAAKPAKAGAMVYVVIEELIPQATRDEKTDICAITFAAGFALMMVLDVALG